MRYDVVIFDLDGTLTDSEPGILRCVQYSLDKLGITGVTQEQLRSFIGPPLFESYTGVVGLDEQRALEAVRLYRERYNEVGWMENSVYPGIPALLRALKGQGAHLAVATSKPEVFTKRILDYFGLAPFFDRVCAIQLSERHADKAKVIREALPAEYRRAIMVGDRMFDMQGGRDAGVDIAAVLYGYGSEGELSAYHPECLAASVTELSNFLLPDDGLIPGQLITFEGSDKGGKTTQIGRLAEWLRMLGYEAVSTREPGGCAIAERIRGILLDVQASGMTPACEALLFAAARAQHVHEVIEPALSRGAIVLCDRYIDSSLAYQGAGRQLGEDAVMAVNQIAIQGRMPDLTLWFSINPEIAMHRRQQADQDRIERAQSDFHERVSGAYRKLADAHPARIKRIDANGTIEQITQQIRHEVMKLLAGRS